LTQRNVKLKYVFSLLSNKIVLNLIQAHGEPEIANKIQTSQKARNMIPHKTTIG